MADGLPGIPDEWDVQSFQLRLTEQVRPLVRFATSLGLQVADAEDVVQDALCAALTLYAKGRAADLIDLTPWLFGVVRRKAIDRHRQAESERRLAIQVNLFLRAGSPGEVGAVELGALVRELEPDHRTAFVLVELWGLTQVEAAHVIGCAQGTVSTRIARARATLRTHVRGDRDA